VIIDVFNHEDEKVRRAATVLARSDFRSKNRAGSSTVSSSLSTCLLERWSGKGSEGVICDALIRTDIQYNQHNHK